MRHLKRIGSAALAVVVLASPSLAQRAVNTGAQAGGARPWNEIGAPLGGLNIGLDDPQFLQIILPAGGLGGRRFLNNNAAIDVTLDWFSQARENTVGFSSYDIGFGLIYGLTTLRPSDRGTFVRPGLAISGGSGGTTSRTTLMVGVGMRRPFHGIVYEPSITLARILESGGLPAQTRIMVASRVAVPLK